MNRMVIIVLILSTLFLLCATLNAFAQFGASPWTAPSGTYAVPAGVSSITIECWGGGGGGGGAKYSGLDPCGGGGGGGAYSITTVAVTPGQNIVVSLGGGGLAGTNAGGNGGVGGTSSVTYLGPTVASAAGGNGGTGSTGGAKAGGAGGSTGTGTVRTGGTGGNGYVGSSYDDGGSGGGGAGSTANGSNGVTGSGGGQSGGEPGGAGGATGGGTGGAGAGALGACVAGSPGNTFGGGGGGAAGYNSGSAAGGAGAAGKVVITYVVVSSTLTLGNNNPGAANKCASTANVILQSFSLAVSGGTGNLTDVSFTSNGTYAASDLSNFKLYYTSTNSFATTNLLSTIASPAVAGLQTFPAFTTPTLTNGSTYYLWITTDVATTVTNNNTVGVNAMAAGNLTGGSSMASSAAAGGTQTLKAAPSSNAGSNQNNCNSTSFTLAGNNPAPGTGAWTCFSGCGGVGITTPSAYNSGVTGVAIGTPSTLTWTVSNAPCTASTSNVTLTNNANSAVSVSITASPSGAICSGTSVVFTATPVNGGAGPSYQWKKNAVNVGTNSTSYTDAVLANGDVITCVLTSNIACPTGNPATSNSITMTVNTTPTITGTTPASRCGTGTVTLGATASAGTINWYTVSTGGISQGAGTSFTTPGISSTTTYYVDATSGSCTTPTRTAVVATVNNIPAQPSAIAGSAAPCAGTSQAYSVTNVAGVTYTWAFPSGWSQTGGGTTNSITATAGTTAGNITVTPSNGCGGGTAQTLAVTIPACLGTIYNNPNGTYTIPCGVVNKLYDAGGSGGNYGNSINQTTTLCAPAGQYLSVVFSDFSTESCAWPSCDHLFIYNGPTTGSPLLGDYYGQNLPPILWTAATGGCLTFNFISDGSFNNRGFAADIVCTSAPAAMAPNTDCVNATCLAGGPIIVNSGNTGGGSTNDLPTGTVKGCLSVGERNTSWYYFDIAASGNLELDIFPNPSSKDYDFALYKLASGCPSAAPIRCSFSWPGGTTGINTSQNSWQCNPSCSSGDVTEDNVTGNNWVDDLAVVAGERYVLVLGDYTSSGASSASVALTGTALYSCLNSLPIELISFKGACNSNKKTFTWATASETNNHFFTLEHSNDANIFFETATVEGSGTTTTNHSYSISIAEADADFKYYRLKQTDYDGQNSYSTLIQVECSGGTPVYSNLKLYPNPSANQLNINFGFPVEGKYTLSIRNVLGKEIKVINYLKNENKDITILINDLPDGIYFLKMNDSSDNNPIPVMKFIVEKPY